MKHGTITGYTTYRCHCDLCTTAWRAYARQWARDSRAGRPRLTDAAETRRHVHRLVAIGLPYAAIAALSGVTGPAVSKIATGASQSCRHATAESILGIAVDDVADGHLVPAEASRRLLRAMSGHGIPRRVVAECMGQVEITQMVGRRVTWHTFKRMATLYEMLARQGRVPADLLEQVGA